MPKHLRLTSIIVLCFFATAPFALATSCDNGCCYGQCTCYDCGGTSGSETVSSIGEAIVGEFMPPGLGTAIEIGRGIYNHWDNIVDFFSPSSSSSSDPLSDRFDTLESQPYGPGY
ncbi:MAG: hypothetical protein OXG97_10080 [Candidatus Poribacteria bacterium]|nr:hypothetical protein [Candidatus Poribacteria bacterium]